MILTEGAPPFGYLSADYIVHDICHCFISLKYRKDHLRGTINPK